jgi:hypothetical protein
MRALAAIVLVGVGLVAGCHRSPGRESPSATVRAFAEDLRAQRYADAYARLSETYRRRVPLDELIRRLEANPDEARDLAALLERVSDEALVTARVTYGDGEILPLVLEDGDFRIAGDVADFYDQSSPRAALRSFVRAMERRRYDVVLRFVPEADLEGMTVEKMRQAWEGTGREEIETLLLRLREALENPIEVVGDRATMPYGERYTALLVREQGIWKIEDPD